jgi:hypothetical protein
VGTTANRLSHGKGDRQDDRTDTIVSAVGATLAAGGIGGGVAVANAQPTPVPPPRPAPTVVEAPELEDSAECAGGVDADNIHEGDQNGPEEPDDCAPPAPPGR